MRLGPVSLEADQVECDASEHSPKVRCDPSISTVRSCRFRFEVLRLAATLGYGCAYDVSSSRRLKGTSRHKDVRKGDASRSKGCSSHELRDTPVESRSQREFTPTPQPSPPNVNSSRSAWQELGPSPAIEFLSFMLSRALSFPLGVFRAFARAFPVHVNVNAAA